MVLGVEDDWRRSVALDCFVACLSSQASSILAAFLD